MHFNSAFESKIIHPLKSVVGTVVRDVKYWILPTDQEHFQLDLPNASGIQGVSLSFDYFKLLFSWGFETMLRTPKNYHHIEVFIAGTEEEDACPDELKTLLQISAVNSLQWRDMLSRRLISAEVYSYESSPQAIRMLFENDAIVIAIGYSETDDSILIGDGDDLLILNDTEWRNESKYVLKGWVRVFSVEADNRLGLP